MTAVLRYGLVIEQGGGGAPEEVVLADRVLQVVGVIWVITFMLGVRGAEVSVDDDPRTEAPHRMGPHRSECRQPGRR